MESLQIQELQDLQDVKPYCHYGDIRKLILEIYHLHNQFSAAWIKKNEAKDFELLNLKKKQVRHVSSVVEEREVFFINESFNHFIRSYMSELKPLTTYCELEYDSQYVKFDLRTRVKQNESVVDKLKYYRVGKEANGVFGAFNLNKCLNDLFGLRIVIENFDHNCKYFYSLCESLKDEYKIRIMDSSKNGYKATHIYFYGGNNRYFPWELQIWNTADVSSNDKSHSIHKREYTKWAVIYKNSEEIEGGA